MAIVVEDGTGSNPAANSYADVDLLKAYAKDGGTSLSGKTNTDLEAALIRAMRYIEAKGKKFKGHKTSASQPLQWPRENVWDVDRKGQLTGSDEIPRQLEAALLDLAIIALSNDLQPNQLPSDKGRVVSEKVDGVVEIAYSNSGTLRDRPYYSNAEDLLSDLYDNKGFYLVRA